MARGREESKLRGNWSSKWDYIVSLCGYAVGLGNVWRFPYLCYRNGGGAFLLPYLVMLLMIGLPLFFLESGLGQFTSSGSISLFNASPMFKGIGYATFIVSLIASTYYSIIVAYPLVFFSYSMSSEVPWASCDNPWNTDRCSQLAVVNNLTVGDRANLMSPADEFFHNVVLEISPGIENADGLQWRLVLAALLVWAFVFLCIFKGVRILGKVLWFTATFPFVMLFVLFVRGVTLPGATDGIIYYIYPDFYKLFSLDVWAAAAVQIFFSLGSGWGTLVTMGSFNGFRNDCLRDALVIPFVNCAASVFAGFAVFSVLGFLAHQMDTHIADVTTGGPALAFIMYPEALALLPLAPLWSALFFLMLFFLGVDSIFVQVQAMVASIMDEHPVLQDKRLWLSGLLCAAMFFGTLTCCTRGGMYVVLLLDLYSIPLPVTFAALLEVVVFAYIYGGGRVVRDLEMMTSRPVSPFWYLTWVAVTPLLLLCILLNIVETTGRIHFRDYVFPFWSAGVGWFISFLPLLAIPVYMVYYLLTAKGDVPKRLKSGINPSPAWGPALEEDKQAWLEYVALHPLQHHRLHHRFEDRPRRPVQPVPEAVPLANLP